MLYCVMSKVLKINQYLNTNKVEWKPKNKNSEKFGL